MKRNKMIALVIAATLAGFAAPSSIVLGEELISEINKKEIQKLVEQVSTKGSISTQSFTLNSLDGYEAYENEFRVTGIKSYSNNGGKHGSSSLDKAFDNDLSTHFETGKPNSASHTNEIIVTFDNVEEINRIVYASRQNASYKGFATKFSVYSSLTEDGDDFQLVGTGTANRTAGYSEFKFENTEFKRLKFVFDESYNSWSSAAEFMFFSEDTLSDKVENLFKDDTFSVVNEEFNSIEKINSLEEEAKNHPLYNKFKEDIENAKLIINSNEVVYSDAMISTFINKDSELLSSYNEKFKISRDKIASITTNGGHYGSSTIEKSIDEDFETSWHSGKTNSDSFTNEVEITLNQLETINRIVYTRANGTNRGFAEAFDIYVSKTSKGDTYELITSGGSATTENSIEIKFNPTEVKRIKFVFKKGYENWALASEFGLYKQDETSEKVSNLFTSELMNEVSQGFNTLEKISALEESINSHPLREEYVEYIDLAKQIISNSNIFDDTRVVTAEQRGKYKEETNIRSINGSAYASFESLGKYVTAGEEIVVYVDADANGVMPTLCFGQVGKGQGDWRRWANLKPGKNVITAPSNINPSALYIFNNAGPEDQAYAPRIRVQGGTNFPTYYHGETDPNEFIDELKAYSQNIEYDDSKFANGNPQGKVYNIAEFVSENCNITTTAMGAIAGLEQIAKDNLTIYNTMEDWEEMYDMFQTFQGFSKNAEDERDTYFPNKFIARVFYGVPLGYADHGYTGYLGSDNRERDGGFFKLIAMPISYRLNDNWCYTHEFGHIFNTTKIVDGEVTNNLYAQEYRRIKGISGDRANWNELFKRFRGEEYSLGYFERLGILSQLNIAYGYDAYAKASTAVRHNREIIDSIQGSELRRLAVAYSLGLGVDLLDFFEDWGYTDVTEKMREAVSHLPKETRKIEYLHGGVYDYAGNGFTDNVQVSVIQNMNEADNTNTLNITVDNENSDDLLGYEIYKDGELLGFTKTNTFVDKNVDVNKNTVYEVIAYAKDLSTADAVVINSSQPTLLASDKVTIKLGEEFNLLDYVKAYDYKGNALSDIQITGNVNNLEKGIYTVNYSITDNDITISEDILVEVVSNYDYLSDLTWQSGTTQYGSIRKNNNLKLLVNGEVKEFEKGIGIHANGEIVYDLSDKDYETFEAIVGVDRGLAEQGNSSIIFKIYADGEEVYNSGKMTWYDEAKVVSLDVNNVKELKIVINDSGNGNTSDHGVIAETKLTTNNAKPEINLEDKIYTLGTAIDFMEGVTAKDTEDGDLTSKVEIVSNTYKEGSLGKFEVTYRVSDSDGNITEKKSYVTVYENLNVYKSKYGEFDTLNKYNEEFKIPVVSVSNNGGNYGSSAISYAIDGNINTHFETGKPNSDSFKNEAIFDLGETVEIDKIAYAARRGGKGFATSFEIYVSEEASGDNFVLAGTGSYNSGNYNDVIEIDITKTSTRRVKFKFVEANQSWASIGEMCFYKEDTVANKVNNELFTDSTKTEVSEKYNTLEKLSILEEEVKHHPGSSLFEEDLNKAKELILSKYPTLNVDNAVSTKLGVEINLNEGFSASDTKDGDLTSSVQILGDVNFKKSGKYDVTYTVVDSNGNKTTKVKTVYVVDMENYDYVSDIDWRSANTSYGQVRKDISVSSNTLRLTDESGNIVNYEKGIGAHSTSTITYDLTKGDYGYFSTFVGVDRQMYGTVGSISFEIYLDGEKVYDTGVMNSKDPQKYIEVDVAGHSELKLVVTDGGNGNGSDHGTFGDTKLYSVSSDSTEINRENLDSLIETINSLNKENYTSKSFENLKNILGRVNEALSDGYNQNEIDELYSLLNEGYKALVKATDYSNLESSLNTAKSIDKSLYTEESITNLENVIEKCNIALESKTSTQEEVEALVQEINKAIENLQERVDLSQAVTVSDSYLKEAIKDELSLLEDTITLGDMEKLTTLTSDSPISNLDGIQYAKNLENININYSEVSDISSLKELKSLKSISIKMDI